MVEKVVRRGDARVVPARAAGASNARAVYPGGALRAGEIDAAAAPRGGRRAPRAPAARAPMRHANDANTRGAHVATASRPAAGIQRSARRAPRARDSRELSLPRREDLPVVQLGRVLVGVLVAVARVVRTQGGVLPDRLADAEEENGTSRARRVVRVVRLPSSRVASPRAERRVPAASSPERREFRRDAPPPPPPPPPPPRVVRFARSSVSGASSLRRTHPVTTT